MFFDGLWRERCGILEAVVVADQLDRLLDELVVVAVEDRPQRRVGFAHRRPRALDEEFGRLAGTELGGQIEQILQRRVDDRAARLRLRRRLREPVDRAIAVEQWALFEVGGPRR